MNIFLSHQSYSGSSSAVYQTSRARSLVTQSLAMDLCALEKSCLLAGSIATNKTCQSCQCIAAGSLLSAAQS